METLVYLNKEETAVTIVRADDETGVVSRIALFPLWSNRRKTLARRMMGTLSETFRVISGVSETINSIRKLTPTGKSHYYFWRDAPTTHLHNVMNVQPDEDSYRVIGESGNTITYIYK